MATNLTGTHPLIQEYNSLVSQINSLDEQRMNKMREIDTAYSSETTLAQKYSLGNVLRGYNRNDGPDTIRFELVPVNTVEMQARKDTWGDRAAYVEVGMKVSVGYRYCNYFDPDTQAQIEGIVCSGGGRNFLTLENSVAYTSFIVCNKEEWDLIAAGNIPAKFLPDWFVPVEVAPVP